MADHSEPDHATTVLPVSADESGQWLVADQPNGRTSWSSFAGAVALSLLVGAFIGAMAASSYYERRPTTGELRLRIARLQTELRAADPEPVDAATTARARLEQQVAELRRDNDLLRLRNERLRTQLARLRAGTVSGPRVR